MTEGPLTHHLMAARELTDDRPDLAQVRFLIDRALMIVRHVHRRQS